jgi:hypothetical protein
MGYIQNGNIYNEDGTIVAVGGDTAASTAGATGAGATAGLIAGGATQNTTASGATQQITPWTWGTAVAPVNPGLNPGYWAGTATPAYAQNGVADVYNWGLRDQNQNATGTQYGAPYSAVAGNETLNIPQFINQEIPQVAHGTGTTAVSPYATAFNPPSSYSTTATQNVTSPIGQSFGGASASPYAMNMPLLTATQAVAPAGATNAGQATSPAVAPTFTQAVSPT